MERNPISAARRLGSRATWSRVWELASNNRSRNGLREVSAKGLSSWGTVKTTGKKLGLGRSSRCASSHRLRACAWHFGQLLDRQELYEMGASYGQSSHLSLCPPRAAVRQRSIARYAFSC